MYFQSYTGIPLPINDINVETYTCSVLRASLKSSCSETNFSFTLVFLIMNTCIKFIEKMRINFLYTDIIHFFIIRAHHQKLLASVRMGDLHFGFKSTPEVQLFCLKSLVSLGFTKRVMQRKEVWGVTQGMHAIMYIPAVVNR